ncbi:MAG: hypothetical protein RL227_1240, partial [Pseudomonadota bacterium]
VAALQRGLRRLGLGSVADMLEGMTQAETVDLLVQARRTVQSGQMARGLNIDRMPAYQRVWHGTPYRGIEQFSTDKIGTGEGVQAYGWGLYFAGKKEIAEHYRKKLSAGGDFTLIDGKRWDFGSDLSKPLSESDRLDNLAVMMLQQAQSADGLEALAKRRDADPAVVKRAREMLPRTTWAPSGQTYEVDIPEDSEMLLWDRPLSEQPANVQKALAPFLARYEQDQRRTMSAFSAADVEREIAANRKTITGQGLYEQAGYMEGGDQRASEYLRSLGIRGIKYLDGTSRNAGTGTFNYVIFDGADAKIAGALFSRRTSQDILNPGGTPSRAEQSRDIQQRIRTTVQDMLGGAGAKVSLWGKTLGTQYAKAQQSPEFKRVFDQVQQYLEDTSTMANEAATKAPGILPKLETWRDLKNFGIDAKDAEAIAGPIFTGTLTDKKVYDDEELRTTFKLTPTQIGQYREFMAAVNTSLDQAAAVDVLKLIGDKNPALRELALTDRAAFRQGLSEYLASEAEAAGEDIQAADEDAGEWTQLLRKVGEKYATIDNLKAEGYAPLMRFGQYKVHITSKDGDTLFFGLYESKPEANRMARELAEDPEFKGATVEQGVLSQEQYRLFSGLPLDSMELFANAIGADQSEVFQEFLKLAKSNRSAMKRLIRRKGTAGFSEDVPRVLASFITSNARMASGGLNLLGAKEAAQGIKAGDVQDEAIKLIDTVQNPTETAGMFRGLMFMNFIGGSIASAVVNLTQPLTMTLPYLSQWGGAKKAAARLMAAGKMAATGKVDSLELRAALKRAENDGIVSPQEIHFLTAQAMGSWGSNPLAQRAAFIWSAPFSLAEQFNRRSSFIAAYLTAKEQGLPDPF